MTVVRAALIPYFCLAGLKSSFCLLPQPGSRWRNNLSHCGPSLTLSKSSFLRRCLLRPRHLWILCLTSPKGSHKATQGFWWASQPFFPVSFPVNCVVARKLCLLGSVCGPASFCLLCVIEVGEGMEATRLTCRCQLPSIQRLHCVSAGVCVCITIYCKVFSPLECCHLHLNLQLEMHSILTTHLMSILSQC